MDTLNAIVLRACEEGLLQPLARRPLPHQVSIYTGDVVLFLRPSHADLELIKAILWLFGDVSGLQTNIHKCSATPIQC